MSLRSVCDAWLIDITTHVSDLSDATLHRYASWSFEALGDAANGRHLAVFPIPSQDVVAHFATGSLPTDLETHWFQGLAWETALTEATRVFDDEDANGAWLDLFERVKGRLHVQANTSLGTTAGFTEYKGWDAGVRGTVRFMRFDFTVRETASFT